MHGVTYFVKTCVLHGQEAPLEEGSFQMWPLAKPQDTFSRKQELQIQQHESYVSRGHFLGRSCARMICSAQDGGPIEDQKESRQLETGPGTLAYPLCREQTK